MKRPYFLTIQKKFAILFLIVGFIPAAAGVALTIYGSRLSFAWATANGLELRTREIADRLGQFIEERHDRLRRVIRDNDGELLRIRLDSAATAGADVLVRYRPGEEVYALPLNEQEAQLAGELRTYGPTFSRYLKDHRVPREGMIDDLRLKDGENGSNARGVIMFVYPEPGPEPGLQAGPEAGRTGGLIIFIVEPRRLLDEVRTTLAQDDTIAVYSRQGYLMASEMTDFDLSPWIRDQIDDGGSSAPGWFNIRDNEGNRRLWFLAAHAPVPRISRLSSPGEGATGSPWIVLLVYDMEIFLGPEATLIWFTVLVSALWGAVLLAVSVYVTRRVVGPVKQLRYQAEAMAAGDLDAQAKVHTRDEIQDLAGAFNTMTRKLRKSYRDLRSRVEESQLRANHIFVINEITKAITQALDLDRTFEILTRDLPKILPYDGLWIALTDKETGRLHVTHATPGSLVESIHRGTVSLEHSFQGQALREMKAARGTIGPLDDSDPSQSGIFTLLGYRSFLVAPLPAVDRALGTVTAVSKQENEYGEEDVEILSSVAGAVAVGIEQAELFRRTREFAHELEVKVKERTRELALANQELIQAEKYAATGRLGANLAHEINNPLGIIKNYLKLSRDSLQRAGGGRRKTDPNYDHLAIIDEEINRIARIVRRLLDLHRPADDNPQRTDIAAMIRDLLTLMEAELRQRGIEVDCDLEADMPHPMVAPDLVRQVYLNLLRNAEDAMEQGGRVTITARSIQMGTGENARPGISVAISDTGCGIDAEGMKHIFDPFYTTKSPELGTGLGLYVSYGIVQRYQGSIDVQSEPGKGTTFTVVLPVDPVQQAVSALTTPAVTAARKERALASGRTD